jgi:hypothetical protein
MMVSIPKTASTTGVSIDSLHTTTLYNLSNPIHTHSSQSLPQLDRVYNSGVSA